MLQLRPLCLQLRDSTPPLICGIIWVKYALRLRILIWLVLRIYLHWVNMVIYTMASCIMHGSRSCVPIVSSRIFPWFICMYYLDVMSYLLCDIQADCYKLPPLCYTIWLLWVTSPVIYKLNVMSYLPYDILSDCYELPPLWKTIWLLCVVSSVIN